VVDGAYCHTDNIYLSAGQLKIPTKTMVMMLNRSLTIDYRYLLFGDSGI
jgi:hypothetical protein